MTAPTSSLQTLETQESSLFNPIFHDLADFLPEAIIILDTTMKVIHLNSAAEDLFGYAAFEANGQEMDIFLHETSTGFLHTPRANRLKKDGDGFQRMGKNRLIFGKHRDGHIIPLDMSLTRRDWHEQTFIVCIPRDISNQIAYIDTLTEPLRNPDGEVISVLGVSRDITERKAAEEEKLRQAGLLEYRQKFEKMLTSISTRFINLSLAEVNLEINRVLKQAGEFEQVDRSYIFLINHDAEQASNTHEWCAPGIEEQIGMMQNIPIYLFPWLKEKLEKLEEIYIPFVSELPAEAQSERILMETLSTKSVLMIPLTIHGTMAGFLGFDSVTSHKLWAPDNILLIKMFGNILSNALMREQTETDLRQSEARNWALLSAVPDQIFRIRHDGVLIDYKASSNELMISPDQIGDVSLSQILEGTLAERVMACIEDVLQNKEIQTLEYTLTVGDSSHVFEARVKHSGEDEVTAIVRDVSDRARLEQMKSDFINQATHELRTPIATILLMINLIEGGTTAEEYKVYWGALKSELNRERKLIEDLLSAGRPEITLEKVRDNNAANMAREMRTPPGILDV